MVTVTVAFFILFVFYRELKNFLPFQIFMYLLMMVAIAQFCISYYGVQRYGNNSYYGILISFVSGQRSELHDSSDSEDGGARYRHSEGVCPGDDTRRSISKRKSRHSESASSGTAS